MTKEQSSASDVIRLITQHQAALLAYILNLHPVRSEANDILQETNVVLWQKVDEIREIKNFRVWAFRIAYLQTLAHFKRAKRGKWLGVSSELVETLANEVEPLLKDFEARHTALRGCLNKLSDNDRGIVRSLRVGGLQNLKCCHFSFI